MSSSARGADRQEADRLPHEVWALIGANAVIALGYGVVAPVLPQLARHFGVSLSAATFVITAFAVMRLCAAPPTGLLIQRLGERRVYIAGVLIVAVSTAACAFAHSYWQLLVYRALGGIGSTMFFVSALGLMIRMSPANARGRVAGMFSGAFLVGSVAGPIVGALTAGLGLSAPFMIYGVLLLIAAVVVLISLRKSPVAAPAAGDELTVTVRVALRHRAYRAALLSNFATGWSMFGLRFALVPLFVAEGLRQSPGVAGLALTAFAIGNVIAVIPSGRLSDQIGRKPLLVIGLVLAGFSTAALGLAPSLPWFLAEAVFAGAASGIFNAPQQAAVADVIGKARGGTAIATFQMMSDFGSIVGSIGVGMLAQHLSFSWSFALSGAILLLAAFGWSFAPETRDESSAGRTPVRVEGLEAAGEVP
ncbi:MAG: MFS transporter [Mycobacterium sp.]|nr:MFS transporter [Mycobacterium sp.]